ncbi:MAG: SPOR domain-containing protein [Pseudomonadota bacterium]
MEPALKQRLLGAAVLVALAVTFLPMLVMDPAPESGASDVPLKLPPAPAPGIETRELPLVEPAAQGGPALAPAQPPADAPAEAAAPAEASPAMFPAPTAGGDFAVSFGSYATAADAARVVGALRASQLPGYAEVVTTGARALHRVRIGPYATRADAEAARLRAAHVRDDVGARVVVLDAATQATATASNAAKPATTPAAKPATTPAAKPAADASAPAAADGRAVATAPRPATAASTPPAPATPPAPQPAAAAVGFAVQLGAFSNAADAQRLQDRARAAGFSAFVEPVRTEAGTLHRVRLGPVADRAAADALRSQAAGRLGVSGIVRPHP